MDQLAEVNAIEVIYRPFKSSPLAFRLSSIQIFLPLTSSPLQIEDEPTPPLLQSARQSNSAHPVHLLFPAAHAIPTGSSFSDAHSGHDAGKGEFMLNKHLSI